MKNKNLCRWMQRILAILLICELLTIADCVAQAREMYIYEPERDSFEPFKNLTRAKKPLHTIAALQKVLPITGVQQIVMDYLGTDWIRAQEIDAPKESRISMAVFSPDAHYLVLSLSNGQILLYERKNNSFVFKQTITKFQGSRWFEFVTQIVFSRDNKYLFVNFGGALFIWQFNDNHYEYFTKIDQINDRIVVSPDGNLFARIRGEMTSDQYQFLIEFWRRTEDAYQKFDKLAADECTRFTFSHDNKHFLIASSHAHRVWLRDINNQFAIVGEAYLTGGINSIIDADDGTTFVTISGGQILVGAIVGKKITWLKSINSDEYGLIAATPNGGHVASEDRVWSFNGSSYTPWLLPPEQKFVQFATDGSYFISNDTKNNKLVIWRNQKPVLHEEKPDDTSEISGYAAAGITAASSAETEAK